MLDSLLLTPSYQCRNDEDRIYQMTSKYVSEFGFKYPRDFVKLTSLTYPYLKEDTVVLVNNFLYWMWVIDDYLDSPSNSFTNKISLINEHLTIINNNWKRENSKMAEMFEDLVHKLEPIMKTLYPILIISIKKALKAVMEKLTILEHRDITLNEYYSLRPKDSGFQITFLLMFIDDPHSYQHFYWKIGLIANEIVWKINDLFSVDKDLRDKVPNYVLFLGNNKENRNIIVNEINYLSRRLAENNYICNERAIIWCRGNLTFHLESQRYSL
jgi:hypothetical protein